MYFRRAVLAVAIVAGVSAQNTNADECTWLTTQTETTAGAPLTCPKAGEVNIVNIDAGLGAYYEENCKGIGCQYLGECRLCVFNTGRYKLANNNQEAQYVDCPCCVSEALYASSDITGCEASGPDMLSTVEAAQCSTDAASCTNSATEAMKNAGIGSYIDEGCVSPALVGCGYTPELGATSDTASCRMCVFDWTAYEANLATANPLMVGTADQHPVQCPCCVPTNYGMPYDSLACVDTSIAVVAVVTTAPAAATQWQTTTFIQGTEAALGAAGASSNVDTSGSGGSGFMADWTEQQKQLFGVGVGVMFWVVLSIIIAVIFKHANRNTVYHKATTKTVEMAESENPMYAEGHGNEEAKHQHGV